MDLYSVAIGDTARSPYCLKRDGARVLDGNPVDYGSSLLEYCLPYLHPRRDYVLRADIYHNGKGPWRQRLHIDKSRSVLLEVPAGQLRTYWVKVPREACADAQVDVRIEKVTGDLAVLAGLAVYEGAVAPPGGVQTFGLAEPGMRVRLRVTPTVFRAQTRIQLALPASQQASVAVYDRLGRLVRVLIQDILPAGAHSLAWDGKDAQGQDAPAGVYFCRLSTPEGSTSDRLVLAR